jgi:hypothetical protein
MALVGSVKVATAPLRPDMLAVRNYAWSYGSRSQSRKTFFRDHAQAIAAIDLFVGTSLTFEQSFAFLVLGQDRRHLLWFEVTRHPPTEWPARQIADALAAFTTKVGMSDTMTKISRQKPHIEAGTYAGIGGHGRLLQQH